MHADRADLNTCSSGTSPLFINLLRCTIVLWLPPLHTFVQKDATVSVGVVMQDVSDTADGMPRRVS